MSSTAPGLPTLAKTANRRRPGTTSRKISTRLEAVSGSWPDRPVTLPPGRARLATRPAPTGSFAAAITIGMTDVACFAAMTAGVVGATMISTLSRANSAAISAKRSLRPSAQRYSIAMLRFSIHPSWCRRCTKTATRWLSTKGVVEPRNPMVGSLPGCCARAASGHAQAVPPSSVMNSRRLAPVSYACAVIFSSAAISIRVYALNVPGTYCRAGRTAADHARAIDQPDHEFSGRGVVPEDVGAAVAVEPASFSNRPWAWRRTRRTAEAYSAGALRRNAYDRPHHHLPGVRVVPDDAALAFTVEIAGADDCPVRCSGTRRTPADDGGPV